MSLRLLHFYPLARAVNIAGGTIPFCRGVGISRQAFSTWRQVPYDRCSDIERVTDGQILDWMLRPDVFAEKAPPGAQLIIRPPSPLLKKEG